MRYVPDEYTYRLVLRRVVFFFFSLRDRVATSGDVLILECSKFVVTNVQLQKGKWCTKNEKHILLIA
jgi:hypothetical protein